MNNLIPTVKEKTKGEIYTMVCFDMTEIIQKKIMEAEHGNN